MARARYTYTATFSDGHKATRSSNRVYTHAWAVRMLDGEEPVHGFAYGSDNAAAGARRTCPRSSAANGVEVVEVQTKDRGPAMRRIATGVYQTLADMNLDGQDVTKCVRMTRDQVEGYWYLEIINNAMECLGQSLCYDTQRECLEFFSWMQRNPIAVVDGEIRGA